MIPPREREAEAIAVLVNLHLEDRDEWGPEHYDAAEVAARVVEPWIRRARVGQAQPPKQTRPVSRPKRDPAELKAAKAVVRARSRGFCEIVHVGCTGQAVHVHHKRRRSQGGTDDPENLLHLCRKGHDFVHANPEISFRKGWLLHALPVATA